jgi:hypothetical protein
MPSGNSHNLPPLIKVESDASLSAVEADDCAMEMIFAEV